VSVVFSISPSRTVHDINVTSRNSRRFVIDLYRDNQSQYETTVTVYEIRGVPGWVFPIETSAKPPGEHFQAALEWIERKYLKQVDPSDAVVDIHNPCNCPFVSAADQERIARSLGITAPIRVT
jgi:hypothetical protein